MYFILLLEFCHKETTIWVVIRKKNLMSRGVRLTFLQPQKLVYNNVIILLILLNVHALNATKYLRFNCTYEMYAFCIILNSTIFISIYLLHFLYNLMWDFHWHDTWLHFSTLSCLKIEIVGFWMTKMRLCYLVDRDLLTFAFLFGLKN